jgi:asparagine N-glycosylation enzyme membrane subunit Stt3
MSYQAQRYLAIVVAVLLAGIAVIQVADPADFGLSPVAAHWLGVVVAMLGVLSSFLPSVRGMGTDPTFLIHRIQELPVHEQQAIASTLADRAERHESDLISKPPEWLPPAR